jgi:type IV pilus assembly protein PilB
MQLLAILTQASIMRSEREYVTRRAMELCIAYVDLERINLDPDLRDLVPIEILQRHQVVPVKRDGKCVWLATFDHRIDAIQKELEEITGCRVIPVLARPEPIREKLELWSSCA